MNAVVRRAAAWALYALGAATVLVALSGLLFLAYIIDADQLAAGIAFSLAVLATGPVGAVCLVVLGPERRSVEDGARPVDAAGPLAHPGVLHPNLMETNR